jgi:hypothetical protein
MIQKQKRPKFIHKYWEVSKPDLLIFSDLVKDVVPTLYHKNQTLSLSMLEIKGEEVWMAIF